MPFAVTNQTIGAAGTLEDSFVAPTASRPNQFTPLNPSVVNVVNVAIAPAAPTAGNLATTIASIKPETKVFEVPCHYRSPLPFTTVLLFLFAAVHRPLPPSSHHAPELTHRNLLFFRHCLTNPSRFNFASPSPKAAAPTAAARRRWST